MFQTRRLKNLYLFIDQELIIISITKLILKAFYKTNYKAESLYVYRYTSLSLSVCQCCTKQEINFSNKCLRITTVEHRYKEMCLKKNNHKK